MKNLLIKKSNELDNYRKKYIGFVFQDYNLIPELTIEENLTIGFTFDNATTNRQISEVLKKVSLSGYEKRFPNELSGGQLQRVAIARSLLKQSKVLLADEPTGNLDKKNAIEVIEILKEISREKLVVIVSHNEDLARLFAHYTIVLDKGVIISNSIDKNILIENSEKYNTDDKCRFSNKTAFKMAFKNITLRKFKILITVLIMLISYASICMTISIFRYHHVDPSYNLIKSRKYEYFNVNNVDYYGYKMMIDYGIDGVVSTNDILYFNSKEEAIRMGIKFYPNDIAFADNTYYISDTSLNSLFSGGSGAIINGVEVKLNYQDFEFNDVIGNYLAIDGFERVVCGIYKNPSNNDYLEAYYGRFILKKDQFTGVDSNKDNITINALYEDSYFNLDSNVYLSVCNKAIIVEKDGVINQYLDPKLNNKQLKDNELYVDLYTYNKIFNTNYKPQYFFDINYKYDPLTHSEVVEYELTTVPIHLNKDVTINIYNKKFDKYKVLENYVIKGIVFEIDDIEYNSLNNLGTTLYFNDDVTSDLTMYVYNFYIWVKTASVKNLQKYLHLLYDNYNIEPITPVSAYLLDFENGIANLQLTMFLSSIVFTIVLFLMTYVLISQSIYLSLNFHKKL